MKPSKKQSRFMRAFAKFYEPKRSKKQKRPPSAGSPVTPLASKR